MKPQTKAAAKAKKPAVKAKPAAKSAPKAAKSAAKAPAKKTPAKPVKTTKPAAKKAVVAKKPVPKTPAKAAKTAPKETKKVTTTAPKKAPVTAAKSPVAKAPAPAAAKASTLSPAAAAAANAVRAMPPRPDAATVSASPARAIKPSARLAQITVPSMAQSVASTAAKASYTQTMSPSVLTPPPLVAVKKDAKLANNWKTKTPDQMSDAEVMAMPDTEYMNDKQMAFFKLKLVQLKQDILNSAGETTEHLREDTVIVPDPADRAPIEEEPALELRTRDRARTQAEDVRRLTGPPVFPEASSTPAMPPKDDNHGLLSKVVKFVRNPTTNWADLDQQESDRESTYSKQMLKEMIERKRRNDFVRKREFDMQRKMRRSEVMAGTDPAARPSFFQSTMPSKPLLLPDQHSDGP